MTKSLFPPCKKCGGWVYADMTVQEGFTVLSHVCINCATEQDSTIVPMVKSQRTTKDIKEQKSNGFYSKYRISPD